MPINFFNNTCKSESSQKKFGLCDDPPPATTPAYIDEHDYSKWIAVVHNPNNEEIFFHAVDHCISITRPDGTQESRCDGILSYGTNLLFVELKERGSSGWLSKASDQLEITYRNFQLNHDVSIYANIEAYACNSLRPMANVGNGAMLQRFKNRTGLILRAQQDIHL